MTIAIVVRLLKEGNLYSQGQYQTILLSRFYLNFKRHRILSGFLM